jgi:hypothetical protein
VNEHRKTQPIAHAVDQHFPAVDVKLHFILAVVQIDISSVDCRVRETIEFRDVIDSEEITAVDFDDLPLDRSDQLANEKAAANRAQNETT